MGRSSAAARRPPAPEASVLKAQSLKASMPKPSLPEALAQKPSAPAGGFARRGQPSSPLQRRAAAIDLDAPADVEVAVEDDRRRGRGAQSNASGRYEPLARVVFDDGWRRLEDLPPFKTTVAIDTARRIITRNDSPDISFDRSINPYRGCEHGCVYC